MKARLFAAAAAITGVLAAQPAAAATTYAAIAFSKTSGAYGFWHRAASRADAEEGAIQECGRGCEVVIWARDACAVLFAGRGNGYGTGWSNDEDEAVATAEDNCNARTRNCELRVMTCSSN